MVSIVESVIPISGGIINIAYKLWTNERSLLEGPKKKFQDIIDSNGNGQVIHKFIACHGWLDNANSFDKLIPLILDAIPNTMICAFDFSGHGKSSHRQNENSYSQFERVLEVLEITDSLNWKTFGLIGHSMGSAVCTFTSGTVPSRIERVILLDGFINNFSTISQAEQIALKYKEKEKTSQRQPRVYKDFDAALEKYVTSNPNISREGAECILRRGTKEIAIDSENDKGTTFSHDPRLIANPLHIMNKEILISFVERIECEVFLVGTNSSMTKWPSFLDAIQKLFVQLKKKQVVMLEGQHHIHLGKYLNLEKKKLKL